MKTLELKQIINRVVKFLLSMIDNRKNLTILYFSLFALSALAVLIGFGLSVYVIWWLLGFGWSLFFFKKNINLLEHFLLGGVVFISLFLLFICIFAIINIPINIFFFLIFVALSFFVFLKFKVFENINLQVEDYDYLVLFLFFVALVAKVWPLRNYYAAPLHDPISHSMMAKKIMETGLIEYFYSPGLHIIAAFGTMMRGFIVSKQVMVLSGIFSAYSGIVIYIFVKNFLKNKVWGLITAILFSVGYYPAMLTFNAGKNTLIMALPILFFVMFTITQYIKDKDWKVLLISGSAIASLFLTHYPMAVIGCVFVGVTFLVYFKEFKWKGFLIILGILFGLGWALRSYKYQIIMQENLVNSDRTSVGYSNGSETVWEAILFLLSNVRSYFQMSLKDWNRYPTLISFFGLSLLFSMSILKKGKKLLLISSWIIGVLLFMVFLSALRISALTIVLESYLISLQIYIYVLCSFFLSRLYEFLVSKFLDKRKWDYIIIGVFLSSIVLISYMLYQKEKEFITGPVNIVLADDVKIFQWMEENIPAENKILTNGYLMYDIIFSSDAGGYIEIFTGRKISMPFYEYDDKDTHGNFEDYMALDKDLNDCKYRQKFIDLGYKYYYQGAVQPFSDPLLSDDDIITTTAFKPVFQSGDSILFEIIGCE